VLVVDDDDATRNGLTVLVERWGYNPWRRPTARRLLKICDDDLPQAIVTDLMMPG